MKRQKKIFSCSNLCTFRVQLKPHIKRRAENFVYLFDCCGCGGWNARNENAVSVERRRGKHNATNTDTHTNAGKPKERERVRVRCLPHKMQTISVKRWNRMKTTETVWFNLEKCFSQKRERNSRNERRKRTDAAQPIWIYFRLYLYYFPHSTFILHTFTRSTFFTGFLFTFSLLLMLTLFPWTTEHVCLCVSYVRINCQRIDQRDNEGDERKCSVVCQSEESSRFTCENTLETVSVHVCVCVWRCVCSFRKFSYKLYYSVAQQRWSNNTKLRC